MAARNFLPRCTAFFNRIPIGSLRYVIRTQCTSVKNSSPPSLAQSSIASESNIMVFKSLHELAPQYMCNLFTKTSQLTSRNLRNTATDLRLPKKNSKNGQECFSFRGARSWNGLTAECKQASSLYSFKQWFV